MVHWIRKLSSVRKGKYMHTIARNIGICLLFVFTLSVYSPIPVVAAETLNPEGINPHAQSPRKRITTEQKKAAAEARKKKKAEIAARRAAEKEAVKKENATR